MDYLNRTGFIGEYRGASVYAIEYERFTPIIAADNNCLFAVKKKNYFELVRHGKLVGTMGRHGTVNMLKSRYYTDFKFYEPKKKKVKEEPKDGYKVYSTVVDEFFAGLNDWWKDLEKEGVSQ